MLKNSDHHKDNLKNVEANKEAIKKIVHDRSLVPKKLQRYNTKTSSFKNWNQVNDERKKAKKQSETKMVE